MKKMRFKKLTSLILACILMLAITIPVFASTDEECADFSSTFHRHTYDDGIVDGGVYSLRNVSSGTYLDVDNGGTASGTNVSTYTYHGGQNQRFQFRYLGKGLYEIKPVYVDLRLHISGDNVIVHTKSRAKPQKMKLQLVGSKTAIIWTEISDFTKAIGISGTNAQQMTYSSLSNKSVAHWVFEYADVGPADMYETFLIRNTNRNLYLDVHDQSSAPGTTVHGYLGLAQANQEWKMVAHESGGYYLKPMNRNDMALSYVGTYLTIQNDNSGNAQQQFFMYPQGTEEGTGFTLYRIGVQTDDGIQYLTMKTQPSYASVHYYVEWEEDATDLWTIERVKADAKDAKPLTLNTWRSGSVVSGYNELAYFTYIPEITSRHKIEFNGTRCFPETPTSNKGSGLLDGNESQVMGNHIETMDVLMQAGVVYYIPIRFASAAGGAYGTFSLRVRQLTFTGHSCPDEEYDMSLDIEGVQNYLEDMNFHFTHREGIDADEAEEATNALTGYSDFNSEIFVYSGHGSPGYACYYGNFSWTMLDADDLPDMSNCELVVWGCCNSATLKGDEYSLFSRSLERGARSVIAWDGVILCGHFNTYIKYLILEIASGKTVQHASQSVLESGHLTEIQGNLVIVRNIHLGGDTAHKIFPHVSQTTAINTAVSSADKTIVTTMQTWKRSNYTLIAENVSMGVKLYSRTVDGIISDDFFIEFYDQDGNLTGIRKSEYTMVDSDVEVATVQLNRYVTMNQTATAAANTENPELQIRYVDGAWVLAEKEEIYGSCDCCILDTVYYNALTGEVIEE